MYFMIYHNLTKEVAGIVMIFNCNSGDCYINWDMNHIIKYIMGRYHNIKCV